MQLDFLRRLFRLAPLVAVAAPSAQSSDQPLEDRARTLLRGLGRDALAGRVRVRWSGKMRSTAGLAYPSKALIALNPRLRDFGELEVERTFLHELAHLLAHDRAGRRRIAPHGPEWRLACRDLGLGKEPRCHNLPLPRRQLERKYAYRCPGCSRLLQRVKPLRGKSACLACCREHNGGRYDQRFTWVKVAAAKAGV